MKIIFPLTLFVLFLVNLSCTKEVKYTKQELYIKAIEADPTMTFVLPDNLTEGIRCSDYTQGCQSGHMVKIKGLELIVVEFMTEDQAIFAAKKFRGYYLANWLFDDVTGEPVLEKFVTEKLGAKKPE